MKVGFLFIDKEGVWNPNELYVLSPHNKFFEASPWFKGEPWITPELTEVHVQGEVLQRDRH